LYQKNPNFKPLIRVIGTSVDGNQTVFQALMQIKGVGRRLSQAIIMILGVEPNLRMGLLTDEQIDNAVEIIKDPIKYGIPMWMVNRQRDPRTGDFIHISGTDLELVKKIDVDRMSRTRSWKGIRHDLHLKVRGQRTRSTGRRGLVVGYVRAKRK
jgi:small subunit ribosomal protein S13